MCKSVLGPSLSQAYVNPSNPRCATTGNSSIIKRNVESLNEMEARQNLHKKCSETQPLRFSTSALIIVEVSSV